MTDYNANTSKALPESPEPEESEETSKVNGEKDATGGVRSGTWGRSRSTSDDP